MKRYMSRICALAMAMVLTSMTGCGADSSSNTEASVSVTNAPVAVTEANTTTFFSEVNATMPVETMPVETTYDETTIEETVETVAETTEDPSTIEWKNSDYYYLGISDLDENKDDLYAIHVLIGGDAIKLYEYGTFDSITDGYDLMWKFGDEQYYYRDFANDNNYTIATTYDCSLDADFEEVGQEVYLSLLYNKLTEDALNNVTKYDMYDPFENGNAEYKDRTVCFLWQKEEGTLEGSQVFYYQISAKIYDYFVENALKIKTSLYFGKHICTLSEDIDGMFNVNGGTSNAETVESSSEEE